ncbi:hypothetical protein SAMN05216489_06288 [Streptomyces sp. 3213]|nr:hypothetical protein [Streptomyces sp. 3213.3]SEE34857.1 hypothetical protein SAMN05216489_06288 [Streptomyces sp. 3213] [Streptomyces sp. 3213.3]
MPQTRVPDRFVNCPAPLDDPALLHDLHHVRRVPERADVGDGAALAHHYVGDLADLDRVQRLVRAEELGGGQGSRTDGVQEGHPQLRHVAELLEIPPVGNRARVRAECHLHPAP